jgi:capsular polysaccharide biosynthesis protein/MinD-like ATPase involved in chromosome partitioning or flagellar assembly
MVSTQTHPASSGQVRLGDYVGLVKRRWWAILLGLLVGLSAAYAYQQTRAVEYTSTASVQVLEIDGLATGAVANGRTNGTLNLDTEAQLVQSSLVQTAAQKLLRTSLPPDELGKSVTVTVPANTSVLDIHFTSDNPQAAAQGAHAFAQAYLGVRGDTAKAAIAGQIKALQAQLASLATLQRQVTGQIAALPVDSPDRAYANARLQNINDTIQTLNQRLAPLQTTPVNPGTIITDAQVPPNSSGPLAILFWASGLLVGLLLGLVLAFAIERGDKRVRRSVDLERELDVPVLVEIPSGQRTDFSVVQNTHSRQGNAFSELRNVLVSLVSDREQIILVAGASDGPAGSIVAANLAVSLARMNLDTVLICADPTSSGRQIFDLDPEAPGLSELLHGGLNVASLEQQPATGHGLRVIPPGVEAELTSEATQVFLTEQAIRQFRHSARFVVIDAPPMSSGSQAQTLARLAHVTVLVVELGMTTHDQVLRSARLIDLVGTRSIGMVAMPRVPVRRERRDAAKAQRAVAEFRRSEPTPSAPGESRGFDPDRYGSPAEDRYGSATEDWYGTGQSAPASGTRRVNGTANGATGTNGSTASGDRAGRTDRSAESAGGYGAGADGVPPAESTDDEPTRFISRPARD